MLIRVVALDQVEAFLAIVRSGGFRRAASSLHISQPAISRRIQLLERTLGAPLFERGRNGAVLTEAGQAFLPHAEALHASSHDGLAAVEAVLGTDRGVVTLALIGTLASTRLTGQLRRLRGAHPGIDLYLRTALGAEVSALVRRGDATLGLRYEHDPDPHLVSSKIHDEVLLPVCAFDHRLARRRRIGPRALSGERWLSFPPPPTTGAELYSSAIERQIAACGITPREVVLINSLTAQKRMVEAGFGLALLPASSVGEELRSGTLRVLRVPELKATVPIVLLRRRYAFESGATKALTKILMDWSPQDPSARSRS
jgi:DNA-binding transcriptional LysR family regulator